MPRERQIIPGYPQPHVSVWVNDYSEYIDDTIQLTPDVDTSMKTIVFSGADKGRDNKLTKWLPGTWETFLRQHGTPSFAKYGQSALYPYNFLFKHTNTSMYYMRVMPDDAAYANSVIVAKYGVQPVSVIVPNPSDPAEPPITETHDEFQVIFNVEKYKPDFAKSPVDLGCLYTDDTANGLLKFAKSFVKTDAPDESGWYSLPILAQNAIGHGKYGNKMSTRFERDIAAERDSGLAKLRLTVIDNYDTVTRSLSYSGTLVNSETGKRVSSFEDVIDTYPENNVNIKVQNFEDNVNTIYQAYINFLSSQPIPLDPEELNVYNQSISTIAEEFNLIFGTLLGSSDTLYGYRQVQTPIPMYNNPDILDPRYLTARDITAGIGQVFEGGTEGSFDRLPAGKTFQDVFAEELVKGINGSKDARIFSKSRTPYHFIYDGNYNYSPEDDTRNVKNALYSLNNYRCRNKFDNPDEGVGSLLFLDSNTGLDDITSSIGNRLDPNWKFVANAQMLALIASYSKFKNRLTSKEFQHYKIYDPFTGKKITVTSIYNMVENHIPHLQSKGIEIPFANDYSIITNIIPGTLAPSLDIMDLDASAELYRQRFNYYSYGDGDVCRRMNQSTSQTILSNLLEENNMVVTNFLINGLEQYAQSKLFKFNEESERKSYTDEVNTLYKNWRGTKLHDFEITFNANAYEIAHKILHCYVAITHRGMTLRMIVELDVNPTDVNA
jgi:hypothetical protein